MYTTIQELIDSVEFASLPEEVQESLPEFERGYTCGENEAGGYLEYMGVPHARERVEWLNIMLFDQEDIEALAQLERFEVRECNNCGEVEYWADPNDWSLFQGVFGNEGFVNWISGTICGEEIYTCLCGDCLSAALIILGVK